MAWPTVLAEANRGEGQELKVTLHARTKNQPLRGAVAGERGRGRAASGAGEPSEEQKRVKRIVTFIKNHRKLDTKFLKLTEYKLRGAEKRRPGTAGVAAATPA